MKIVRIIFMLFVFGLCGAGVLCAEPATELVKSNNQFAFDLYGRYAAKEGNVFFSPYSLFTALGMTYEGARGVTADEMRKVLYFPEDDMARRSETMDRIRQMNRVDKPFELTTVNALWVQKDFVLEQSYLEIVKSTYAGEARNLDFFTDAENSRITINNWVMEQTQDRIKDLLPSGSLDASTRMVLTNAVYFKGKWQHAFDKTRTTSQSFWVLPDRSTDVDMMLLKEKLFYTENALAQVLNLPYKGDELSMAIILPKDKTITALEAQFTREELKAWWSTMQREEVLVSLPRFEFDAARELSNDLRSLGMMTALDGRADFSGMTGARDLFIGGVFHKAWVKVDEEGTEAAAATAVTMTLKAIAEPEPKVFRADHPFMFIIHENKTGEILFMGRVSDPSLK